MLGCVNLFRRRRLEGFENIIEPRVVRFIVLSEFKIEEPKVEIMEV